MNLPKIKSLLSGLIKLAISGGLLAWFITTGRLPLGDLWGLARPDVIILGCLLAGGTLAFASERWRLILHSQGFQARPLPTFRMTLIGIFFNTFMPGGVGGDVVKGYYVVQNLENQKARAVATVIFDRILGLFTMVLMALAAVLIEWEILLRNPTLRTFALFLALLTGFFMFTFYLLWSRKTDGFRNKVLDSLAVFPWIQRNLARLNQFNLRRWQFFQIIFLSTLAQTMSIAFFVVIARLLGYSDIPLAVFLFVVPLGFIATAIPISPGGIGVGQAAFFFLFNLALEQESQVGAVTITAFQLFSVGYGIIGALLYVFVRHNLQLHDKMHLDIGQD